MIPPSASPVRRGLLEKQGVCLPPVYAGEVERVELEDEHGPVEFWLLPFLKPGDERRFFPDEESATTIRPRCVRC